MLNQTNDTPDSIQIISHKYAWVNKMSQIWENRIRWLNKTITNIFDFLHEFYAIHILIVALPASDSLHNKISSTIDIFECWVIRRLTKQRFFKNVQPKNGTNFFSKLAMRPRALGPKCIINGEPTRTQRFSDICRFWSEEYNDLWLPCI